MKLAWAVLSLVSIFVVADSVFLEVPGYATIEGITATSHHLKRQFFKFRGLYYAEKPNAATRYLVKMIQIDLYF
jgi:hypothetical protein